MEKTFIHILYYKAIKTITSNKINTTFVWILILNTAVSFPVGGICPVLQAYSTHRSCLDQDEGFLDTMQRRAVSIFWFIHSV